MESDKVKEKIIEALAEDDDLNEYVEIVRNVKGVEDFGDFLERLIGLSYYKLNWARGGHLSSCFKENYSYLNRNPNDPVAYFFNYSRDIPEALVKESGIIRVIMNWLRGLRIDLRLQVSLRSYLKRIQWLLGLMIGGLTSSY